MGLAGAVLTFRGIVQGVGFRPHLYREAHRLGLRGTIRNTERGVHVEMDGPKEKIELLYRFIIEHPPSMADITESSLDYGRPFGFEDLEIVSSSDGSGGFTPLSPDIATCPECIAELKDPADRRFGYPFINCTNCGPRFTIIESIPYDRPHTTMSVFTMCDACRREYENPLDRRYHAQPNGCPACGPAVRLLSMDGEGHPGEPVGETIRLLGEGKIVAVRGLGGYHLALSPRKPDWIRRLRERKRRPGKPFALMAGSLEGVRRYCRVNDTEEELLLSPERPIVLLRKREGGGDVLPSDVSPDTDTLGFMLPYTPLHHLLLMGGQDPLIMTSANRAEEPLIYGEKEALCDLKGIADAILTNNREIARPCDDSVMAVVGEMPVMLRRARGYTPRAIPVVQHNKNDQSDSQIFAAGSHERNTFCVYREGKAFVSHHIGDLENVKSVDAYGRGVKDFLDMFRVAPDRVACDLHPDYASTRFAEDFAHRRGLPLIRVQHHFAHIASVLGENGTSDRVIGIAFDGTGYGPDGTIWGGEFLLADASGYERVGHLETVGMPGGESCIREIDRMGLSCLIRAYGTLEEIPDFPFMETLDHGRAALIAKMIAESVNCPRTSSCGRYFDGVSSLLGLCARPSYDAQGPILLETLAGTLPSETVPYPYDIGEDRTVGFGPAIRAVVEDIRRGGERGEIARKFHRTVVMSAADVCGLVRGMSGVDTVALSGGVFQNRTILSEMIRTLRERDFHVLFHRDLPPNDGCISFGQVVAAHELDG